MSFNAFLIHTTGGNSRKRSILWGLLKRQDVFFLFRESVRTWNHAYERCLRNVLGGWVREEERDLLVLLGEEEERSGGEESAGTTLGSWVEITERVS